MADQPLLRNWLLKLPNSTKSLIIFTGEREGAKNATFGLNFTQIYETSPEKVRRCG